MRFTTLLISLYLVGVIVPQASSVAQGVRIEAESGSLNGFSILQAAFFSGGAATNAQVTNPTATYTFSGWDGPYDITVGYCDEDDGTSSYTLSGSSTGPIASWQGDQPTGETNCNPTSLLTREIVTSVALEQGETITLECQRSGQEPCRVDFFDFSYVGPMPPVGERAFPGARGFGAFASGARGLDAQVCAVTTLADSGPGSFRDCADKASPVYITFATSGYVDLVDEVRITGNMTVECATAPGDGIVFRGASIDVVGDNVIVRGCRAWPGKDASDEPLEARDGIFVGRNGVLVRHAIVANSSMMLATDENSGTWYQVDDVTLQRNIIAWGTRWVDEKNEENGGLGLLIGNDLATVSAVENYLAFNNGRNPLVSPDLLHQLGTPVEVINNLIHCYGNHSPDATRVRRSSSVHVIGNQYRPCPDGSSPATEIRLILDSTAYVDDNIMSDGSTATVVADSTSNVSPSPLFTSHIAPMPSTQVESRVFANAGPARLIAFEKVAFEDYMNDTGGIIESVEELGGWPTLEAGINPPDSEGDGMPDWWEEAHCSGPCSPTGDADGDGYENIEEWFHSFYRVRVPVGLEVDVSPVGSDGNRVFEPGEQVEVAPSWRNRAMSTVSVNGTASSFAGPVGATYTVVADDASYGGLGPGESGSCRDTGICYRMSLSDPAVRPATHWEASFEESVPGGGSIRPWTLHIGDTFTDVSRSSPFYRAIEAILHHGVTTGCGAATYCPGSSVNRGQMAVFMLKAKEGAGYLPPTCVAGDELFGDVPSSNPSCRWIEELANRGVVSGCGGGNYCPSNSVTRAQMAVFLLKTLEGGSYAPPACGGIFADVACPSTFANWVEDVYARGIAGGCSSAPLMYCPTAAVSRGQMAVFLGNTFGLSLYGP